MSTQPVVKENTVISSALDYKTLKASAPSYQLSKILPTNSNAITITPTSGANEILIEIPTKCFNIAESILHFVLTMPAGGGGVYNWLGMHTLGVFRQIQLYTRSGQYIADLQNLRQYLATTYFKDVKNGELEARSQHEFFFRSDEPTLASNRHPDGTNAWVPNREIRYFGVGAENAELKLEFNFKLSDIKDTYFSKSIDLMYPEVLMLRFVCEAGQQFAFTNDSATNPASAPDAPPNITLSDVYLMLAVEQNQDIVNEIQTLMSSSGLSIPIDYLYSYKNSPNAATSQVISLKFNRAHGATLKRVIQTVWDNDEKYNKAYNRANGVVALNNKPVSSLYTLLDNIRMQQINVNSANTTNPLTEDYMFMKSLLKDSATINSLVYYSNWFWEDNFSHVNDGKNVVQGLDLSTEHKWDIYMTTRNVAQNYYTFAVTQKMLTITSSLISIQ